MWPLNSFHDVDKGGRKHRVRYLKELNEGGCISLPSAPHSSPSTGRGIQWKCFIKELENSEAERMPAGETLRESEEWFRKIFEEAHLGIVITSPSLAFGKANPAFCRMMGYSADELRSMTFADITHPDHLQQDVENVKKVGRGEMPFYEIEKRYIHKSGKVLWGNLFVSSLRDKHGALRFYLAMVNDITERKRAEKQLQDTLGSLRRAVGVTIQVMVSAVEARDPYTAGHQLRSSDIARAIATEIGLSQDRIDGIRIASSVHDIGKLSVPAEILSKPTKLSELEFSLIKEHVLSGYKILKNVESPWPLAQIVYQHHERMDGSGYPRHLKGEEILMDARILAVADVVEAMSSNRPYRPAVGEDAALKEIENNRGILYDTGVVDACLRVFRAKNFQFERT